MWHQLLGCFCGLCRQSVTGLAGTRGLCDHCLAELPWRADPEAHDLDENLITRVIAPLHYRDVPQRWVLAAKRENGLVASRLLGTLLAEVLEDAYPHRTGRPTHIIPVPLSWQRLLSRGHNQAQWIARPVARTLALPLATRMVKRQRHTALQPGLSPEARQRNLDGAFRARGTLADRHIAIVDDVLTSGATVEALARCLLDAGAASVHCWAATAATRA